MESDIVSLSSHATFGEVAQLLHDHKFPTFPLVDGMGYSTAYLFGVGELTSCFHYSETGIFLGIVRRRNLVKVVSAHKIDYANLPSGSPFGNYHNNEKVVSGSGELHETGADDDESSIPLDEPAAPGEVQSKRRERSGKTDLTSVTQSIKNALGGGGSGDSTFDQYSKEDIMNQPIPLVFPGARRALDSAATCVSPLIPFVVKIRSGN
jgi:CBS domain-containing protein